MSYQYHGTTDLIALPNRTVQTYPSGLVRVERSFVCRKDQVARYRNTIKVNEPMPFDDGAPAIDGLYIFPEPQEIVRDDGFVEFRVTAYGRTIVSSEIVFEKSLIQSAYLLIREQIISGQSATDTLQPRSVNELYTFRGVIPTTQSIGAILSPPQIQSPSVFPVGSTVPLLPGKVQFNESALLGGTSLVYRYTLTTVTIVLFDFTSTNFGRWLEYIITWGATATVIDAYEGR